MLSLLLKEKKLLLFIVFEMNSALVSEMDKYHQGMGPWRSAGEAL